MFDLFYMASPLFMGILTLLLLLIIVLSIKSIFQSAETEGKHLKDTELIKSLGLLSLVLGMLGFLIGMFSAMDIIESASGVSPGVLAGGLKVALITPIYGLIIYGVCHLICIFLRRH